MGNDIIWINKEEATRLAEKHYYRTLKDIGDKLVEDLKNDPNYLEKCLN